MASYQAEFSKIAQKEFFDLDQVVQKRIAKKIAFFLEQSNPVGFAKHLHDFKDGDYRWRVGKYRIIFDLNDEKKLIMVLHIEHRRSVYRHN